ncbi:hypothetical protein B7Y92_00295 [Candidatus Saccharibacteria bacterium 32-50-13]|nr:MAG: hypothetical protein B7Y92_00295 [Candidatus Saccharibacteria bacterium 32-50-13]
MSLALERIAPSHFEVLPQRPQPKLHLVRDQYADRHVVVPDIHGEHEVLGEIVDRYYDDPDIGFVFLGDILDRKGVINDPEKGVFKTLDIIKNLGGRAVVTMANHEWLFHASSSANDPGFRESLTKEWLGNDSATAIERNVLVSYGMDPSRRDHTTAKELRRRMARAGHLAILASATPYFETDAFIATHAGVLPNVSWEVQRNYLNEVSKEMDEGLFYDRPPQWFSMKLATSTEPVYHTNKTVVSGHAHVLNGKRGTSSERSLHDGRRIRLASTLNAPTRAPVYIWQDWDGEIIEIPRGSQEV